uniref:Uncharacterized protein n=1 Tax=Hyaloperonospora arabidopsidis (strain Emoy2) TaxID=559515 RepID=M4B3J8_HYAAE
MIPNDVGGEAYGATPAVVADGQEMTNDHELEEKSAVPMMAFDKILPMLGDLSDSVCRMKPHSPHKVTKNARTLESQAFLIRLWEQVQV